MALTRITSAGISDGVIDVADISDNTITGAKLASDIAITTSGTTTLTGNLSVDGGTIKLDGNYPTSTESVALGNLSLNNSFTGVRNTAIGSNSSTSMTTGANNVGIGSASIQSNTTGSANNAIGRLALTVNTTGNNNNALGFQALQNNTASNNTAVGHQSLTSNTSGTLSAAVGYLAGNANTTGRITAIGADSLKVNTTGTNNVALGAGAGQTLTTGSGNTFIGDQAGLLATTGTGNIFIGNDSGYLVTTGAKNTVIGSYDGNSGGLDIRTSSNNIVLSDGDGNVRAYHNGTAWVGGNFISDVDVYRMSTTETTAPLTVEVLDDWERCDEGTFSKLGDGVSHSAGVFTFPRTGIYLVTLNGMFDSNSSTSFYNGIYIQTTTDGGSNWEDHAFNTDQVDNTINARGSATTHGILDITDTANRKVRVRVFSNASIKVYGDTNSNTTTISFIRLGDT